MTGDVDAPDQGAAASALRSSRHSPPITGVIAYDRAGYDASDSGDPHIEKLLIEALCYLETDERQFMHLDEVPMILDHLDEMVARRSQGVWRKVPVVC